MGGSGICERRNEVFLKIQRKKIFLGEEVGLGGGGGGQGGCERKSFVKI